MGGELSMVGVFSSYWKRETKISFIEHEVMVWTRYLSLRRKIYLVFLVPYSRARGRGSHGIPLGLVGGLVQV